MTGDGKELFNSLKVSLALLALGRARYFQTAGYD
jgi:hypothetical protein